VSDAVPTAVYRLFGGDDLLLYIGVAKYFGRRWHQHAQAQPWWPEVRRQAVDWYPSRAEALAAETSAIKAEFPRYNVAHNGPRPEPAVATLALAPAPPSVLPQGVASLTDQALADHLGITIEELKGLPVTMTLKEAAPLLGIGRSRAYDLASAGTFPCRIMPLGKRTVVPTFALLRTPGVTVNATKLRALVIRGAAA
jgi:hypothetical protein